MSEKELINIIDRYIKDKKDQRGYTWSKNEYILGYLDCCNEIKELLKEVTK